MNLLRHVLALAAATMATAALAPAADASTTRFSFDAATGVPSRTEAYSSLPFTRLAIVRNGTEVGSSESPNTVVLGDLTAGDVATLYNGSAVVATAVYEDLPRLLDDTCIGRSTFTARRGPNAEIVEAGAYVAYDDEEIESFWTSEQDAVVSLKRPLASGDVAYVQTVAGDADVAVYSSRSRQVQACYQQPIAPPPAVILPPAIQPSVTPSELTPTSAQLLQMVKGSLSASVTSLRAHSTRSLARHSTVAVPFAFPEPGRVDMQLVAKNAVIGSGAKPSAINGKAIFAIKLTSAGRKLLKRSKTLKVTLKATFTRSRAGAVPQRASAKVTLTGSSWRA